MPYEKDPFLFDSVMDRAKIYTTAAGAAVMYIVCVLLFRFIGGSLFGSWEYNHLVGIIKISVENSSIIYELYGQTPWVKRYYWYTSKRKALRRRQIIGTHFYIGDERSNENIQNKVADYLLHSIVRDYIPSNYYVDTEAFLNVNKYIDYLDLVEKMAVC